ncbi:MAG: glycine-rich domain-containing protein [Candidatus Moraniibacteriota bacterium]
MSIDSGGAGAIDIGTGANAKTITIGNATNVTAVNINSGTAGITLQVAGAGVTGTVQVGVGGATGSTTPDLLGLDTKSDGGNPSGAEGKMYYNLNAHKFRCYVGTGWADCITGTTMPLFRAVGTAATGTTTVTPGLPAGHATNDILILFVQSSNEFVTAPSGYTQIGPQHGSGTNVVAGANRLAMFWKRDGGAESAPTVADSGDHTYAVIAAFSGCPTTGDPFKYVSGGEKTTASGSGSATGGQTTIDNSLIVTAVTTSLDAVSSATYSSWANTSLSSVTEQFDGGIADGTGGSIGIVTGGKAAAGAVGATTVTESSSTVDAYATIALLPADEQQIGASNEGTEIQEFTNISPGTTTTDTWVKPYGAQSIEIIAIGGGGAGGAGIASTAASGGGGGGGAYVRKVFDAYELPATLNVTVGKGGVGGATKSAATASVVVNGSNTVVSAGFGVIGATAASGGSGGLGGSGGSAGSLVAPTTGASPGTQSVGSLGAGPGTGGSTGGIGGKAEMGGGGGGGGKAAAGSGTGGTSEYGGGGGGAGGTITNGAVGGVGGGGQVGGTNAGGSATATGIFTLGGSGGGGNFSTGVGGNGAQPGGGGGGGGAAATNGGNGGNGAVTIIVHF